MDRKVLAGMSVPGSLLLAGPITAIGEVQLKAWLIEWDRSLKTKANYHGLIHGVFGYAVKRGYQAANPATGTAPTGGHAVTSGGVPMSEVKPLWKWGLVVVWF